MSITDQALKVTTEVTPREVAASDPETTADLLSDIAAELLAVRKVLRKIEWSFGGSCPMCMTTFRRHKADCVLAAVLSAWGQESRVKDRGVIEGDYSVLSNGRRR